jgi:hypothetical protein
VRIVEACLQAGKPERIIPALLDRRSPESVAAELAAERTAAPPAAAGSSTCRGSNPFGDPDPKTWNALREATRRRLEAMYGRDR